MGVTRLRADLHNHSCLSPCADLSMSPSLMARTARARGVDILALTDHNASMNCGAFAIACAREGVIPLFGMEMNSSEEVHILALFPTPREALAFGAELHSLIPELPWDSGAFGDQVVVDEDEGVLELHGRWLGAALDAPFGGLASKARLAGALVIPAHVDRGMFSVHSQLGFLPPGPYDAVESMGPPPAFLTGGHCAISGSDAHYPEHLGRRPFLVDMDGAPVEEMRRALVDYGNALAARGAGRRPGAAASEAGAAQGPGAAAGKEWDGPEPAFLGYPSLLSDPRLDLYPTVEARNFMENLREALRDGKVIPTHLAHSLI
jgi:hypothetical protein